MIVALGGSMRKKRTCSICGSLKHNKRRCRVVKKRDKKGRFAPKMERPQHFQHTPTTVEGWRVFYTELLRLDDLTKYVLGFEDSIVLATNIFYYLGVSDKDDVEKRYKQAQGFLFAYMAIFGMQALRSEYLRVLDENYRVCLKEL